MNKWKQIARIGSLMSLILVMVGCSGVSQQTTDRIGGNDGINQLQQLTKVKVAIDNGPAEVGIFLGDHLGYFAEQGIAIEPVKFPSGPDMLLALASEQIDVTRGVINAGLFNAYARGIDVKLVADGGHNDPLSPYYSIVIAKSLEGKVKDYKDLKGLRIGIANEGSINEIFLAQALEKGGLTMQDIEKVIIDSFPDLTTAIANGAVDAVIQLEPLITQGLKNGTYALFKNPVEYAPEEQLAILMYGKRMMKDKELGNRFMVAYLKGIRAYHEAIISGDKNREQVIDILTQYTFVNDKELYAQMNKPLLDPDGTILKKGIENDQNYYFENQLIKQKVDVGQMIDNSYIEAALKVIGPYEQ
ncbi:ABC transporter substrate-binding protein [Paenibacillus arenosi]|uniref:ABC transporter substrate-binding protein n=1 Tax=Paenibacillus arenosi TaxID=2774142 RepID=A0ABR9AZG4_9BACL|nr:ABC transporter substrate-binding protein [Paenibacillus arenosi]MBD8499539.1 ABC transporter substrate-binding protein [Paenibacillus arenosi]